MKNKLLILSICGFLLAGCGNNSPSNVQEDSSSDKPLTKSQQQQLDLENLINEEASRAKDFTFSNVNENAENTHKALDVFEVDFDISEEFESGDMFSENVVDIKAKIQTPSGENKDVIAFYKQNSSPQWAFRYLPDEEGTYSYTLYDAKNEEIKTNPVNFEISKTDAQIGKISVQGDRFVDSYGNQFTPVGTNYLDIPLNEVASYGVGNNYKAKIPLFKEQGNANLLRVWGEYHAGVFQLELAPGTYTECGSTKTFEGIGKYQLDNAFNMDELLKTAMDNDMFINITLFNQWSFGSNFGKNAYNKEVEGGMCTYSGSTTDFWTHVVAMKYQKQLIRYYCARYSAYRSFGIMEWWNEVDSHASAVNDLGTIKWLRTMNEYWDSINVNNVITSNSFAWKDHDAGNNPWSNYSYIDCAQPHMYIARGNDPVESWINTINNIKEVYAGPIFYGEFSEDQAEHFSNAILNDIKGSSDLYFMEGFWSPVFFAGAAGGSLYWKTAGAFTPNEDGFRYMKTFADFMEANKAKLPSLTFNYLGKDENGIQSGGYFGKDTALIYVRDEKANDTNQTYKVSPDNKQDTAIAPAYLTANPRTNTNYKLEVSGLNDGNYTLTFVNVLTGEKTVQDGTVSNGKIEVTYPEFVRGIALSITSK